MSVSGFCQCLIYLRVYSVSSGATTKTLLVGLGKVPQPLVVNRHMVSLAPTWIGYREPTRITLSRCGSGPREKSPAACLQCPTDQLVCRLSTAPALPEGRRFSLRLWPFLFLVELASRQLHGAAYFLRILAPVDVKTKFLLHNSALISTEGNQCGLYRLNPSKLPSLDSMPAKRIEHE